MRHRVAGKTLSRNARHRLALYRNLALALFRHERIITTLPKAKAVKPFVEKLITLARKGTLHARRLAIARLGPMHSAEVRPESDENESTQPDARTIVKKLFDELGPRFKNRPGGYTRIIKRHERRLGDAGHTAYLELLQEGEVKVRARAPSVAPRIEEGPSITEEPVTPEQPAVPPAETAATEATPPPSTAPEAEKPAS
jgi:large subunit ribosomal protein L17